MTRSSSRTYVDHPAPSVVLMIILAFTACAMIAGVASLAGRAEPAPWALWAIMVGGLAVLGFFFWPLYTTYYAVSAAGIQVRYGPWTKEYPWSDFAGSYWRKGLFATRIGWPTTTPCVRLTNCVQLKRRKGWFDLYLTPNDPKAFLVRIGELAPDLTRETIL